MNTLTNPRWLFAVNTLPLLIFSFLAYRQYTLIESLLEAGSKQEWTVFAVLTALIIASVVGVAVWLDTAKKKIPVAFLAGLFIVSVAYLAYGMYHMDQLVPWSIPRWLGGEDLVLYFITFVMPTLGYCLLGSVHYATPEAEQRLIWPNFLGAIAIPLVVYLLGTVVMPLLRGINVRDISEHLFVVFFIISTVSFLFFLVRGLYLLAIRREAAFQKRRILWMIPLAIVFPLLGLLINNGDVQPGRIGGMGGDVFGDFSNIWFYLLAGLNGLLLCLPAYDNKLYRLYLYIGKAIGMAFIAYFFVVFLPFLPLSIPAILFFGLGFLMLTPLLLFPVQLSSLREDRNYLTHHFDRKFLTAIGVVAFLLLPLIITLNYQRDKNTLNQALSYVYAPAEADAVAINLSSLNRVLATIDEHKGRRNDFGFGSGTPYLSSFYRWLVLDNLTLSDAKMNDLRRIFLGDSGWENYDVRNTGDEAVRLTNTTVQTEWDPKQEAWSSWVELEITADSTIFRGEYATEFDLPPGVFIADYYLYVGDRKEYGLLAEKKAATWVYNNIVNANRDPGLLRYKTANRVAFNVFPFATGEVRRTGIRFLHKEPLSLQFDDRQLALGRVGEHPISEVVTDPSGKTIYVPKDVKGALTQVQRKDRVHFVVDASRQSRETEQAMIDNIKTAVEELPAESLLPKVTLAGTYPQHFDFDEDWEAALAALPEGGFFARRAIEEILATDLTASPPNPAARIVIVANDGNRPVLDGDFSAYSEALPAGDDFYFLDQNGDLSAHSLTDQPWMQRSDSVRLQTISSVYAYPDAVAPTHFLSVDDAPAVLTLPTTENLDYELLPAKHWASALALRGQYLRHQYAGQTGYRPWLSEVRGSFHAGILMPTTAFLVVENEAQREALRRKQAETLDADPSFDLEEEEIRSMSEPGLIWGLVLLLLLVAGEQRYRRRQMP
ncbi:MAG: MSEP-CTERM sorting domain-containing protein [Lewinella sp.]